MDKAYPLSTPMVVRSLEVSKDSFRPLEEGEEILGPEVPYLSAISALIYLANATRLDITFTYGGTAISWAIYKIFYCCYFFKSC